MNYTKCLKKVMLLLLASASMFTVSCSDDDDKSTDPTGIVVNDKLQVSIKNLSGLWAEVDSAGVDPDANYKLLSRGYFFSEGKASHLKTKDGDLLPFGYTTYCIDSDKTEENLPFVFRNENGQMRETVKASHDDATPAETVLLFQPMLYEKCDSTTTQWGYREYTEQTCEVSASGFSYTPLNVIHYETGYTFAGEVKPEVFVSVEFIDEDTILITQDGQKSLLKRIKGNYKFRLHEVA